MTPLERLTAILCECESVKKDIMELREGCIIEFDNWKRRKVFTVEIFWTQCLQLQRKNRAAQVFVDEALEWENYKIIWNPIQDHHLRMYCEYKWIFYTISTAGYIVFENSERWIKLEPKSLYQQSNETLEALIEFIENILPKD